QQQGHADGAPGQPRLAPAPGGGGARDHVVLAGGVADAGACIHASGLDVRGVHVVAMRNMRANRKPLIRGGLTAADGVRPDILGVRADAADPFSGPWHLPPEARDLAAVARCVTASPGPAAATVYNRRPSEGVSPSMCGIVGAIADRDVVPVLIEGLKRLEYRGYDSAGIAVVDDGQGDRRDIRRVRRTGRVAEMEAASEGLHADLGIGHTRWATHGGVTELNAHPHVSQGVALVHNGIIENHEQQRERLQTLGYAFESQTDTEVIAHLIHHYLTQGHDLLAALQRAVKDLHGAYALAVVSRAEPDRMVCARMGCPLLVGL